MRTATKPPVSLRAVSIRLAAALSLAALAMGCLPKIGDRCTTSLDCSQTGQKICDGTQPAGYCTVFNCEPDNCPDSAACVAFNNNVDPACASHDDGQWPRFERTFCVRPCTPESDNPAGPYSQSDCRDGYDCVPAEARGGIVIDVKTIHAGICLAAVTVPPIGASVPPVCDPKDSDPPLPDPWEPPVTSTGGGGAGGTGGGGGLGGSSGAGGSGGASGSGGAGGASGSAGTGGV